jgi:pimeloyl-ACP methyl ester carboxylesterase
MDQRNAGRSTAPVSASDGWHTYTADQLALLDHLGIERCHVAGMCIGGSYVLGLLEAAPERFAAAVLFQPIGYDDNRDAFLEMFDTWADELRPAHPEATDHDWTSFRQNMYGGDFTFNSSREFVAGCRTPMLVLKGADVYHPASTTLEIAELAPNATLIDEWKEGPAQDAARAAVAEFLLDHTPAV